MATVGSAFDSAVSSDAYSYILRNIPRDLRNDPFLERDYSALPGSQTVKGTSASDYVILGPGDKLAKSAGALKGFDIVETSGSININQTGFRGVVLTGDSNAKVTGSSFGDSIVGNDGQNSLKAGAGNDVAAGGGGNDSVFGAAGNDSLFGDAGNDKLFGGTGNDLVKGGEGNDAIRGDVGKDRLHGGAGDDNLKGGVGTDSLLGDAGNDSLFGDAENDLLKGGDGNDRLYGGTGDDRLYGDSDNDYLDGMVGDDRLFGGAGDDRLFGGAGDDSLLGQSGSDYLRGGSGDDTFKIQKGLADDIDTIADFNANDDVIDLSSTAAHKTKMKGLLLESDGDGNTIVTVKADGTQFKLVGYDPNDIDSTFFHF